MKQTTGAPRLLHVTTVPQSLFFLRGQPRYLAARGWEVHAVSSPGDLLDKFAAVENVPVHQIEMPRSITPLKDLVAVVRLWRLIRKLKPDIVDAHTPKGGLLGMIAARLAGVPVRIYHMHGLPFVTASGLRRWLLRRTEAISCALAHEVLCVSPSIRDMLVAERLCSPLKAKVLLNGSINGVDATHQFNPERFSELERNSIRASLSIPLDAQVIGFVGRITRDKGFLELISAWQCWRVEFPHAHLLILGQLEDRNSTIETMFSDLRRDPRAHIISDWVDDPAPYYASMDVLAFPTHREGFGLAALEAAAMGIPVVASAISGCIDAVQDSRTGTLIPAKNPTALNKAVNEYLRNSKLALQRGRAGRVRVLDSFDRHEIHDALYNEYLRLVEKQLNYPG